MMNSSAHFAPPVGDNNEAVAFLLRWAPEGPWVLTAINVDKKGTSTDTFVPEDTSRLLKWLKQHNGQDNIYFHVNPTKTAMRKKASREDIAAMAWLHVDVDPRQGEDLDEERQRILNRLTVDLPTGIPKPTVVVYSGGGYQGFWKLEEPFPIDGDPLKYEEAKRYNQQIEILFGADNCHNVDRIMRLPGTVNLPDAGKKRKGRTAVKAELVYFDDTLVYPLGQFKPAPKQQGGDQGFSSGDTVVISGNIRRLEDINELDEWNVPDRVKVIIVQGRHPDEAKAGDSSRSAWLFDCLCQLARCKVPPDVMYSIITDMNFSISASVLDKGSGTERYAKRQVERAIDEAIDPWLRKFNDDFFTIGNLGGKYLVGERVEKIAEGIAYRTDKFQKPSEFKQRFAHCKIEDVTGPKPIQVPAAGWWLQHSGRRMYETAEFRPGEEGPPKIYNLWTGFGVDPIKGENDRAFREHVFAIVCSKRRDLYKYVIRWMADAVQNPSRPGQVALVLRGEQGVGKGEFASRFAKLFGSHSRQISNSAHLIGKFNAHLGSTILLFVDEAFLSEDRKSEGVLKALITESSIMVERKGIDATEAPNALHVIMASNSDWVVPTATDDRRFCVIDVSNVRKGDRSYFARIRSSMVEGGYRNLLFRLMQVDLSIFDVFRIPVTGAKADQKRMSLSAIQSHLVRCAGSGCLPGTLTSKGNNPDCIVVDDMVKAIAEELRALRVSAPPNIAERVRSELKKYALRRDDGKFCVRQINLGNGARPRAFVMPPLAIFRERLAELMPIEGWDSTVLEWSMAHEYIRHTGF